METTPASPRKTFLVRANCEFSIEIEAKNAEEAIEKAGHLDFEKHWTWAWAPMEAEEA
jgi:hypothetical protein